MRIRLSTGREFNANGGILGLTFDAERAFESATLYGGYDNPVCQGEPRQPWHEPDEERFTEAERREIAERMIARWRQWAGLLP